MVAPENIPYGDTGETDDAQITEQQGSYQTTDDDGCDDSGLHLCVCVMEELCPLDEWLWWRSE